MSIVAVSFKCEILKNLLTFRRSKKQNNKIQMHITAFLLLSTTPSHLAQMETLIDAITGFPNENEMSSGISVPLASLHYRLFPNPAKTHLTRKCLKICM